MDDWEKKRKFLLDDVPESIKKTKLQDEPSSGLAALHTIALSAVVHSESEGWFNAHELAGVSDLLHRTVRGVRVHPNPRRQFFDPEEHRKCNRLTVMLADRECKFRDDGVNRTRKKKTTEQWCGITVFYHDLPDQEVKAVYFMDTPAGLVKTPLTHEEWVNVTDTYDGWSHAAEKKKHDVHLLTLKTNSKELDPRYFDK